MKFYSPIHILLVGHDTGAFSNNLHVGFPGIVLSIRNIHQQLKARLPTFSGNLAFAIFTNLLVINIFASQPKVRLFRFRIRGDAYVTCRGSWFA